MVQALEGAHKPGEGGVWAAAREARENQERKEAMLSTHGILQTSGSISDSHSRGPQEDVWEWEKSVLP